MTDTLLGGPGSVVEARPPDRRMKPLPQDETSLSASAPTIATAIWKLNRSGPVAPLSNAVPEPVERTKPSLGSVASRAPLTATTTMAQAVGLPPKPVMTTDLLPAVRLPRIHCSASTSPWPLVVVWPAVSPPTVTPWIPTPPPARSTAMQATQQSPARNTQLETVRLPVFCVGSKKLPVPTTVAVMLLPIPTPAMRRFRTLILVSLVRGMVSLQPSQV